MKYIRASRKVEKAIDALIDLQQDYYEECQRAEIEYEVQITLDTLNRLNTALDAM
ncbi:hypothetical protein LCGC14_1727860 [marine sediment metagenome]|uniref:Uncharacterized protein n=1 Tax=marine sediment metagenome TaxID=412755 RepID=A0A0F9HY82_9ZZZZ